MNQQIQIISKTIIFGGTFLDTAIQSQLGYFPWDFILVNPKLRDSNGNNKGEKYQWTNYNLLTI